MRYQIPFKMHAVGQTLTVLFEIECFYTVIAILKASLHVQCNYCIALLSVVVSETEPTSFW